MRTEEEIRKFQNELKGGYFRTYLSEQTIRNRIRLLEWVLNDKEEKLEVEKP